MANVEQTQMMIPFVTCEISLGEHVGKLAFGVDAFDLDLGVQIGLVQQPIKSNSVSSRKMPRCRASS